MNEKSIHQFMSLIGTAPTLKRGEWVLASCPLAFARHDKGKDSRPSFAIKINEQGDSICNCFACNIKGSLEALLMELNHEYKKTPSLSINLAQAYQFLEDSTVSGYVSPGGWTSVIKDQKPYEPWPEWWLEHYPHALESKKASDYLMSRHVPPVVSDFLDVRWDLKFFRVGFPFRDKNSELAGMRGRSVLPEAGLKHFDYDWNGNTNSHLIWLGEHWINYSQPIVIVEGAFDLIAVFRYYRNVVANFTASVMWDKTVKLIQSPKIVLFFDNDKAGQYACENLTKVIAGKTKVVRVKYSSSFKDPGSMPTDDLQVALMDHVELDPFIHKNADSIKF
jgi:5S rRNA maturation endonuclease (ribonuclease M5)